MTEDVTVPVIISALSVTYNDAGINTWLRSQNRTLGGVSPASLLGTREGRLKIAEAIARIGDCDPRLLDI